MSLMSFMNRPKCLLADKTINKIISSKLTNVKKRGSSCKNRKKPKIKKRERTFCYTLKTLGSNYIQYQFLTQVDKFEEERKPLKKLKEAKN